MINVFRPMGWLIITLLLMSCSADHPDATKVLPSQGSSQGETRVINYWAIWCAPCREEIPELNALARENVGKIAVQAVNFDNVSGDELRQQAAKLGIQFELLETDPGPALGIARPTVLPTTLIVSAENELMHRLIGPQTQETLSAYLETGS